VNTEDDNNGATQRALGRIEGQMTALIAAQAAHAQATAARDALFDHRIGKVEARQHWYAGAGAAVGGLGAIMAKKIGLY
jgi:hypothetical protein